MNSRITQWLSLRVFFDVCRKMTSFLIFNLRYIKFQLQSVCKKLPVCLMYRFWALRKNRREGAEAGFTLLEMLVVLVILALLAGIVGPRVVGYLEGAKSKTAKTQIEQLATALELYLLDVGEYPNSEQGLKALVEAPSDAVTWNGPYLRKTVVPADPWGVAYIYRSPGQHGAFDILTYGADKREGGSGDAEDIVSWQ